MNKANPFKKHKLVIRLIIGIILYSITVTSSTYAFMSFNATSSTATGEGGCFEVSYTGQNIAAGTIQATTTYTEGTHTTVTLSKASTCKIYTEANIYLYTNSSSTAPIDSVPALRYKIMNGSTIVEEGFVNAKGNVHLATVPLTNTQTTYTIYLWVDSNLSLGAYNATEYSGYIYAESAQSSTVENSYLINFDTNGGESLSPKTVTLGENYGTLPTPTRAGYTFKGWIIGEAHNLPSGYEELEYIQLSGNQYIDTGLQTKQSLELNCEFSTTTAGKLLFGGRTSTTNDAIAFGSFASNMSYVGFGGSTNNYSTTVNLLDGNKHSVKLSDTTYKIDNVNQTINNRSTLTNYYNIYLGTWNTNNAADSRRFIGKIYSFSITDNSSLVRNFIPCINKTTNKVGLYDLVEGKFYGNAGTGDFTAGNLEYITNSTTVTQTSNHTLTAVWEPNTYTLTFNPNGGTVSPTTKQIAYGGTYGELPTPTKSGSAFQGWNGKNLLNYNNLISNAISTGGIRVSSDGYVSDISPTSDPRAWGYANSNWQVNLNSGTYTIALLFSTPISSDKTAAAFNIYNDSNTNINAKNYTAMVSKEIVTSTFTLSENTNIGIFIKGYDGVYRIQLEKESASTTWEPYFINSTTPITQASNHTLTAIWE